MKYGIACAVLPWLSLGVLGMASCPPKPEPSGYSSCRDVPSVAKAIANHRDYVEVVTRDSTTKELTRWCMVQVGECAGDGGCKVDPLPPGAKAFLARPPGTNELDWNRGGTFNTFISPMYKPPDPGPGGEPVPHRFSDPFYPRARCTRGCQECECDPKPILNPNTAYQVAEGAELSCPGLPVYLCSGE